jgi:RND family efflux transporter MFP subunit
MNELEPRQGDIETRQQGDEEKRKPGGSSMRWWIVILLVCLAPCLLICYRLWARQAADPTGTVPANHRLRVETARAKPSDAKVDLKLPATARPLDEVAIRPRINGYLKAPEVDFGARVEKGKVLAGIDAPEIDKQLLQAQAQSKEAQATYERNDSADVLAKRELARVRDLYSTGAAAEEELDKATAAAASTRAALKVSDASRKASEANVDRLQALKEFQTIKAPFPGVITARNYDEGALVVADNPAQKELFHLSRIDTLRVDVEVPQLYAYLVRTGGPQVDVFRREAPDQVFKGDVTRTTETLDPVTRTMRVEIEVKNPDGALKPGTFLQVQFHFEAPTRTVQIPGAAIITGSDGMHVTLVDEHGTLRKRAVKLGHDNGQLVEVVSGLSVGETVVVRPGDDLKEGKAVEKVPLDGWE